MKKSKIVRFKDNVARGEQYLRGAGIAVPHEHLLELASILQGAKGWREHKAKLEQASARRTIEAPFIGKKPVHLYVHASAVDEWADGPQYCYCQITQKWLDRLVEVAALCRQTGVFNMDVDELDADEWLSEHDEWHTEMGDAAVYEDSFFFQCYEKHTNLRFNSRIIDLAPFLKAVEQAAKRRDRTIRQVDAPDELDAVIQATGFNPNP